jgi:spermidine synthase
VAGALFAGFYLLRVYDMNAATYTAAAMNVLVAAIAFLLAKRTSRAPESRTIPDALERGPGQSSHTTVVSGSWLVYAAITLSGATAMGAQVVWTRLLSLLFGTTAYSFSIILAVFLLGLGIGSVAGSIYAARTSDPRRAFGICQALAAAAIAWTAYMLTQVLPYWPIDPTMARNPWLNFSLDFICTAWAILPAACLWGASFPLALGALVTRGQDTGRLAGGVYAWNTLGAIVGAAGFSVVFTHRLGTQLAQQVLAGTAGTAALLLLASPPLLSGTKRTLGRRAPAAAAVLIAAIAVATVQPVPGSVIGYGRATARTLAQRDPITNEYFVPNILYVGEGMNASVAVSQTPEGYRNFHVSGKIEASTESQDMRLQRMLGHLPGLLHSKPVSVLIVGFGAGVTAGSFVSHPGIERIVICEIEPLIPRVVAQYFANENNRVLEDPRVEIIYDDARHFLLTTNEKFDVITSDPIHPWVRGAAMLYTREYFDLVREHLNPGGVVSQWVPLYQSSTEVVQSELATFFDVFRNGTIWSNDVSGRGYDLVLIGRDTAAAIDADQFEQRLRRSDHAEVAKSLRETGFASALDLLATYAASGSELSAWLAGSDINRDRNLRLQYLAGLGLDRDEGALIHEAMLKHRETSPGVFTGSQARLDELFSTISRRQPRTLSQAQASAISNALAAGPSRRISVSSVLGNPEALRYATEISRAVTAGGWEVDGVRQSVFTDLVIGMLISVGTEPPPPHANELFRALRSAGLTAPGHVDPNASPDSVLLFVGEKQ